MGSDKVIQMLGYYYIKHKTNGHKPKYTLLPMKYMN